MVYCVRLHPVRQIPLKFVLLIPTTLVYLDIDAAIAATPGITKKLISGTVAVLASFMSLARELPSTCAILLGPRSSGCNYDDGPVRSAGVRLRERYRELRDLLRWCRRGGRDRRGSRKL